MHHALELTDVGKMPTKTQHEPRRRGTDEPGRAGTLALSRSCRAPGPQSEPSTSVRAAGRQATDPPQTSACRRSCSHERLEVGPCKLVTSLREEEEGMQGRRQLFL